MRSSLFVSYCCIVNQHTCSMFNLHVLVNPSLYCWWVWAWFDWTPYVVLAGWKQDIRLDCVFIWSVKLSFRLIQIVEQAPRFSFVGVFWPAVAHSISWLFYNTAVCSFAFKVSLGKVIPIQDKCPFETKSKSAV